MTPRTLTFTLFLVLGSTVALAQNPVPDTPAAREARETAPQLYAYTQTVLFGDLWKRPELSPRDRSLVTMSVLIANGQGAQLTSHINLALENGVKPKEISGQITHLAFYTGWPSATSAVGVAKAVFAQRGIDAKELKALPEDVLYADLWKQADLTLRDRSLITVAALIARGQLEALNSQLELARVHGLTKVQIAEAATHIAFYAGWPRAMSALPAIRTAFEDRK